ncbi:hypothetical protein LTR96_010648 [Exophiala xenobiotica]|nr:hypothetical protein LTR92_005150 [Exophiala xenobiotica]KAK5263930.1 hypothetical protein LTR96_010648 [Exophiala xenobiotica]KAK5340978.1 hypothetical protein LTR98_001770 [Exophiala xenobiotica]KAK5551370.1 hypothetical protein LTR46_010571 [Exophiala xenobiotica]
MADPLSITASIVAVVQVAGAIINTITGLKASTKSIKKLKYEIDSIRSILLPALDRLERLRGNEVVSLQFLPAQGLLEEFRLQLEHLEKWLAPAIGLNKVRRAVTWKLKHAEVKDILDTIERQKTLFVLTLQIPCPTIPKSCAAKIMRASQSSMQVWQK